MTAPRPIPVTVLGGYLGAGKTTLLNGLLRDDHGLRLAILVNDFGSINIDAALVASHGGETISLTNGCVCCSLGDNLAVTLLELMGGPLPPDHIVIEASGVADPRRIAFYGEAHPGLRLDAVIVVVDAESIGERLTDKYVGEVVLRQLLAADLLVLSKLDLISPPERARVYSLLATMSPQARVVEGWAGQLHRDILLGTSLAQPNPNSRGSPGLEYSTGKVHEAQFCRGSFETERAFDRERLKSAVSSLPDSVLRAKGLLYLADEETNAVLLQKVGRRWSLEKGPAWEKGTRRSRLIFIGAGAEFNPAEISSRFALALASGPP